MATKMEERQSFIRYYKQQTGTQEVVMKEVAEFAVRMGWKLPPPTEPIDLLAKQFAEAAREEIRVDKKTERPYKANHAITKSLGNGRQLTFWVDVDEAPRHQMAKAMTLYREQMVGEAVICTNTVDHWNRINPDQMPLEFPTDFTDDVAWRLNALEDVTVS